MGISVTIFYRYLVSIGCRNRHHRTQHRHVHRNRHTHKTFTQSDRQRLNIHLHASLFGNHLGILDFIGRNAHFECVHNLIHQARTFGWLLASRVNNAPHFLSRQPETWHHL